MSLLTKSLTSPCKVDTFDSITASLLPKSIILLSIVRIFRSIFVSLSTSRAISVVNNVSLLFKLIISFSAFVISAVIITLLSTISLISPSFFVILASEMISFAITSSISLSSLIILPSDITFLSSNVVTSPSSFVILASDITVPFSNCATLSPVITSCAIKSSTSPVNFVICVFITVSVFVRVVIFASRIESVFSNCVS